MCEKFEKENITCRKKYECDKGKIKCVFVPFAYALEFIIDCFVK